MKLEDKLNQHFSKSIERVDPAIKNKLQQARLKALSQAQPTRFTPSSFWGSAVASFVFIMMFFYWMPQHNTPSEAEPIAAFELIMEEDPELFEQLEFNVWLSEELES